jgi:hypothetical protein
VGHSSSTRQVQPECEQAHVQRRQREDQIHDRQVLAVAAQEDVGGDHERRREAEAQRRPGKHLEPVRRHVVAMRGPV